jgi:hypothetical protein
MKAALRVLRCRLVEDTLCVHGGTVPAGDRHRLLFATTCMGKARIEVTAE